ncbi:Bug family tripartite tricarboxylate transporter substrate binding protein [Teichococcus vastitatis]|uniref:Tripartite tricarboxylate transporter substrate binding protein n=1 Tax=Teichococcus vastitatis TaxID=2307076 RepID=A0ABS9VZH8_9PROT|nr:tripartite tricarboxylate transporter substrate binding protein [Pseudoroseomonas vastitatis]MCI0752323.1 tripartite tricarboxylate transporter substrate binding protein [Pseudoroseomonas vastitatis]
MFIPSPSRRTLLGGLLATGLLPLAARAQDGWPSRPIRLVVPFGAGTSTDIVARLLVPRMSQILGQPIVVENRAGAGGVVGSDAVAKSPPDGYTLCLGSIASHSVNMSLMPQMPYDVLRDFTPLSLVTEAPNLLVVSSSVPAATLPEFIEWSKKQRGGVSYASAGNGTSSHLAGELLKLKTGAPLVHVPYKSGAQAVTDVIGGTVPMTIYQVTAVLPFVRDGKLKALSTTSAKRLEIAPDVPTAIEQGVADFDVAAWHGLFAPAKLPTPVRDRIYAALREALFAPELQEQLRNQGLIPVGSNPAEFRPWLEQDIAKWREVVRISGATAD